MGTKLFTKEHRIRFSECDPAGIVFYPQYFVLFNDLLEEWIDTLIPEGFHGLIREKKVGMPTVHLNADFRSISQMGDDVVFSIGIIRLGGRSIRLRLQCIGRDGVLRMQVEQVIVTTSLLTHKAISVPEFLRIPMQEYVLPEVETQIS